MSIVVQAWVYANSETRLSDRLVLLAIADEADDDGKNAFPSLRRIAHKARVSLPTAHAAVERLEAAGALLVQRPETTGRGHHNRYTVPMGNVQEPEPSADPETFGNVRKRSAQACTDPQTHSPLEDQDPPKPARARFLEFDALVEAFGTPGTREEEAFYAKVARSLKAQGKSPEEIVAYGKRARARHAECTVNILLTRWSNFGPPRGQAPGSTWEDVAARDQARNGS